VPAPPRIGSSADLGDRGNFTSPKKKHRKRHKKHRKGHRKSHKHEQRGAGR